MLPPLLFGNNGAVRGRAVVVGGTGGSSDGGFVGEPVVSTTVSGGSTISGKIKSGSFGKFVYPLATVAAGHQYTFRYTPHFAQLMQQGKSAMVGFGFKTNNDFHLVGLRGDGSTGLHKYKVYGTPPNGWNQQTGHTTVDGGASANGTQAGPNWIRIIISADGTTYTFKTSPDGSTWSTEFSGAALTPFSNVSGAVTFGVALWFNNADAGPFSIDIDQFADAPAVTDPYFSNVVLLLGFEGTDGATSTTDESSSHKTVTFLGNAQLDTAQKKFGSSSLLLDGSGDTIRLADSIDWQLGASNNDPWTVETFVRWNTLTSTKRGLMGQGSGASTQLSWTLTGTTTIGELGIVLSNSGTSDDVTVVTTGASMTTGVWYHCAVDKDATGKIRVYVDGVMRGSATPANSAIFDSNQPLYVGGQRNGIVPMDGWLDEVRITKGVARYASDSGFTVPTAAFPRS
ncbi:MAG: LamG domain-containing protein [Mesorhizobium sp.]|uniref:LamG domain-containing protein n=1 Tax=Mesorhizobium sp. TaxID=1871066 RepID=UPI000FE5802B|nr:LamG domain-containing protein [Mesorhizobium sp.]RWL87730.1 MAG: LamG domain-containing protein [Mesorhizobium sp.]